MQTKNITWKGAHIHYQVTGSGMPVVLLHGFGEDGSIWKNQIDALQDKFQLIIPDIPGSGLSDLVADATIETYVAIIKEILDTELNKNADGFIKKPTTFFGHSMGGYICLAFAEKHPEYLNSFGLLHSSAFADSAEKKQARKKAIEFIQTKGANSFLKTSIPGLFSSEFAAKYFYKIESLIEQSKSFSNEALIQYYEAMIARPDRTSVLKNFKFPILFIIGEQDNAVPMINSLQQCYLPVQSHVHILQNAAHMGMWEEAEKTNSVLLNFLNWVQIAVS